jgi:hypothetical protein
MIEFEANIEQLPRPVTPQRVFFKHYQSTDETSPPCLSLADLMTITSHDTAVSVNIGNPDPLITLKSIEKFDLLPPKTKLFKCHIASRADYKEYIKDEDNIIFGSQDFHNYFDGMMTTSGEPEFALKYGGNEGQANMVVDQFQNVKPMWKVKVIFEFRDPEIFRWCQVFFREFSTVEGSPCALMIYLYFFDLAKAEKFLKIKYEETKKQWNS